LLRNVCVCPSEHRAVKSFAWFDAVEFYEWLLSGAENFLSLTIDSLKNQNGG